MKYWDLKGEGDFKKALLGAALVLGCVANVAVAGFTLVVKRGPHYAVRTDREGHSDLLVLPAGVAPTFVIARGSGGEKLLVLADGARPTLLESQHFLEILIIRLFAWDDATKESDRSFVLPKLSASVRERLPQLVPGYARSLEAGLKGRVDVDVETTRVVSAALPYQIEVRLSVEFSGGYLPPGLGEKDADNPRKETYGFLFELSEAGRSRENPTGLLVTGITPVQLQGEAS